MVRCLQVIGQTEPNRDTRLARDVEQAERRLPPAKPIQITSYLDLVRQAGVLRTIPSKKSLHACARIIFSLFLFLKTLMIRIKSIRNGKYQIYTQWKVSNLYAMGNQSLSIKSIRNDKILGWRHLSTGRGSHVNNWLD